MQINAATLKILVSKRQLGNKEYTSRGQCATELAERMSTIFENLTAPRREVRQSQRDYYDAQQHRLSFQENDLVFLYKPSRQVRLALEWQANLTLEWAI